MSIQTTFELHQGAYYTIARLYTAALGTAMIPLTSLLTGTVLRQSVKEREYRRLAQILSAGLIAFSPIFVENSAYSAPDVPLAFTVLLATYLCMRYVRSGSMKTLCAAAFVTGVSVTIKYPGAILCFLIAFVVIYRAVQEKRYGAVVIRGLCCIAIILVTVFVIAPELILYYYNAIAVIKMEARSVHLGADGLGFWGNLLYYFENAVWSAGALSVVFMLAGVVFLLLRRNIEHSFALCGLFFWICMSVLPLHWLRWGMPMYPFYIILTAIGAMGLIGGFWRRAKLPVTIRRAAIGAASACMALVIVNGAVSSAALVKQRLTKDTRIAALEYCTEHGITAENSVFEVYTPFSLAIGQSNDEQLKMVGDELQLAEEAADREYFVFSNSFRGRYLQEPERYADKIARYDLIEKSLPLVKSWQATARSGNVWEIPNILSNIRYIMKRGILSGSDLWIYRLHPQAQP